MDLYTSIILKLSQIFFCSQESISEVSRQSKHEKTNYAQCEKKKHLGSGPNFHPAKKMKKKNLKETKDHQIKIKSDMLLLYIYI